MEEWPLRVHESRQSSPGMQSLSPNLKEGETLDKEWKKKTHVASTFEPEVLAAFFVCLFPLVYVTVSGSFKQDCDHPIHDFKFEYPL